VYLCGVTYSIYVHMNLYLSVYSYMSTIGMYVYNVHMVMYVLTYTCVCVCLRVCVCLHSES